MDTYWKTPTQYGVSEFYHITGVEAVKTNSSITVYAVCNAAVADADAREFCFKRQQQLITIIAAVTDSKHQYFNEQFKSSIECGFYKPATKEAFDSFVKYIISKSTDL